MGLICGATYKSVSSVNRISFSFIWCSIGRWLFVFAHKERVGFSTYMIYLFVACKLPFLSFVVVYWLAGLSFLLF